MSLKIVCLGDPVVDLLAKAPRTSLGRLGIAEGGCLAVSNEDLKHLLASLDVDGQLRRAGGGSAANVAKGLANLLGDNGKVSFAGRIGDDIAGRDYELELQRQQVEPALCQAEDEGTATCLCMVTEDGQRTMRTCLASASGLVSINQLPNGWLQGCKLLHMEGYVLYRPNLAREAVQSAKAQGAQVSLDLSSFELVQHCKDILTELLEAGFVDVVACNEEEAAMVAKILAEPSTIADTSNQAAQAYLLRFCQVSVISLGAKGCLVQGKNADPISCIAPGVSVKDTVGAGDYFTAGFLYAFVLQQTLKTCGEIGCCVGSGSVQHEGASLGKAAWSNLRESVHTIIAQTGRVAQVRDKDPLK